MASLRRWMVGCGAAAALTMGLPATIVGAAPVASAAAAPDGPGALSHFDLARKDCVGTARNTGSKVWYTVANGVLSDVYYPTVDNTNVETLQYVVTDGSTFTDLQTRDMTSSAKALDAGGMVCEVTSTAKSGRYRIVTDYFTDPGRNTLLMNVQLVPTGAGANALQLYVRFDPTVNGNGGGGSGNGGEDSAVTDTSTGHPIAVAYDTVTATNAANRDYAQPVFAALDGPFSQVTNGFAGCGQRRADPARLGALAHLDLRLGHGRQRGPGRSAEPGTRRRQGGARARLRRHPGHGGGAAEASLAAKVQQVQKSYEAGWSAYDAVAQGAAEEAARPRPTAAVGELGREYYLSANIVKASEDKTFPGAIVAGLASPWGQAVSAGDPNNTYFGSYREVFSRDLYEAWTGLMAAGDMATARDATLFLFNRQQLPDGSMPRNSLVNGKTAPDSFGTQLDETAYPILMADTLGLSTASFYATTSSRRRTSSSPMARRSARSGGRSSPASRRRPSPPRSPD